VGIEIYGLEKQKALSKIIIAQCMNGCCGNHITCLSKEDKVKECLRVCKVRKTKLNIDMYKFLNDLLIFNADQYMLKTYKRFKKCETEVCSGKCLKDDLLKTVINKH